MEKTAVVIATMKYYDIELDRHVFKKEILSVSTNRAKVLIENNVCELVSIK